MRLVRVVLGVVVLACLVCAAGSPALAGSATVVNRTSWDLHQIYLSPSSQSTWGPDQLEEDILAKGRSFTLYGIECGDWDVKLVDEVGDECVVSAVRLCGDQEWVLTDDELLSCQGYDGASRAGTGTVTFTNRSSWSIHYVYVSPSSQSTWGDDHLGDDVLDPGQYLELSGVACGTYDVKLVDEDDDVCVLEDVELCGEEGWTITDAVLLACIAGS